MNSPSEIYVGHLRRAFNQRRSLNPAYSLRAFARDLKMSPASVSLLLKGKKGLSESMAKALGQRLALNAKEQDLFLLSAMAKHSRAAQKKKAAGEQLQTLIEKSKTVRQISTKDMEHVQSWYHMAILELFALKSFKSNIKWMAQKLGIADDLVQTALKRLQRVGLAKKSGDSYKPSHLNSSTETDIPSSAIKSFHNEVLEKAKSALYIDPVETREFLSMTCAFNRADLNEAKAAIREFQNEFDARFCHEKKTKDSVYQFSVQFFRIDKDINEEIK